MKWVLQAAAVLVVVVVGIAGFTFIRHYVSKPARPTKATPSPAVPEALDPPLAFPRPNYPPGDYDHKSENDADFWYENTSGKPVELGGVTKTCVCTSVETLSWQPQTWREWLSAGEGDALAALAAPDAAGLLLPAAAGLLAARVEKQVVHEDKVSTTVVPGGDGKTPQFGIVRLHWGAKNLGPRDLSATFGARPVGSTGRVDVTLGIPTVVVPPLMIRSDTLDLGEINPGQVRTGEFVCYSTTRDHLPLKVVTREPSDPCLEFAAVPLAGDELAAAVGAPPKLPPGVPKPPGVPLAGYKVRVTLREKAGDKQLDIGPFSRRLRLESDLDETLTPTVTVRATVRGEFRISGDTPADRDRISLGNFKADRDAWVVVTVLGQPGVELEPAPEIVPEDLRTALKAELTKTEPDGDRPQWRLKVTALGGKLFGAIPSSTAVVLGIKGSPRKLRIPVQGTPEGR
jgi:hypothetical protein